MKLKKKKFVVVMVVALILAVVAFLGYKQQTLNDSVEKACKEIGVEFVSSKVGFEFIQGYFLDNLTVVCNGVEELNNENMCKMFAMFSDAYYDATKRTILRDDVYINSGEKWYTFSSSKERDVVYCDGQRIAIKSKKSAETKNESVVKDTSGKERKKCSVCSGNGTKSNPKKYEAGENYYITCDYCNGTGYVYK